MERTFSLEAAAFDIAREIWAGSWKHVPSLKAKPVQDCPEIIEELRKRCPGKSEAAYRQAITKAIYEAK
jgi:hypothetical protein